MVSDILGILYDIPEPEKVGSSYKRVVEFQDIEENIVCQKNGGFVRKKFNYLFLGVKIYAKVTMWDELAEAFLLKAEDAE